MDTTTHTSNQDEIWEQLGREFWKLLPAHLRPRYGEVFILLIIHDGELVKARGKTECGVRYDKADSGEG